MHLKIASNFMDADHTLEMRALLPSRRPLRVVRD
jgi:hypothetical protein